MRDDVIGIAGHVEHAWRVAVAKNALGGVPPAAAGHDDIRKQQIDGTVMDLRQLFGLLGTPGLQNREAGVGQDSFGQLSELRVVVYEQDGLAPAFGKRARGDLRNLLNLFIYPREIDPEYGAGARPALYADESPALFDDS